MTETIGAKLVELRRRSGMTLEEISALAGYRGRSSVQQFFRNDYAPEALDAKVAARLAAALVGRGDPPITRENVASLANLAILDDADEKVWLRLRMDREDRPRTIPIFSARRAKPISLFARPSNEQISVEAMTFEQSDPAGQAWFPPAKNPVTKAYCLYLGSNTLAPRYGKGEMIVVEERRDAVVGNDVILHLDEAQRGEKFFTHVIAGRLHEYADDGVILRTLTPDLLLHVPNEAIQRLERILSVEEILAG